MPRGVKITELTRRTEVTGELIACIDPKTTETYAIEVNRFDDIVKAQDEVCKIFYSGRDCMIVPIANDGD